MNKVMKKLLCACLALAMLITIIPPVTAEAATKTEKMTLYKGEKYYLTNYNTVTGVSSTKKSVVAIAKDKKYDTHANITAKKAGVSTITVKTKRGTMKYKITVKNLAVTGTLRDMGNGKLLLTVKNKTKSTFSSVTLEYTLKNEAGEVVEKDKVNVYDVVAGKTVYKSIWYSTYNYTVDVSQCSVKAVSDDRNPTCTYTNRSSKITASVEETISDNGDVEFSVKSKNTLKKDRVNGYHYIILYDAQNNIIGLETVSIYLNAGAVSTDTAKYIAPYNTQQPYDHYKLITVAYSYKY